MSSKLSVTFIVLWFNCLLLSLGLSSHDLKKAASTYLSLQLKQLNSDSRLFNIQSTNLSSEVKLDYNKDFI